MTIGKLCYNVMVISITVMHELSAKYVYVLEKCHFYKTRIVIYVYALHAQTHRRMH